jgi:hypothetical protein
VIWKVNPPWVKVAPSARPAKVPVIPPVAVRIVKLSPIAAA